MKGIDILVKSISLTECPSDYGLTDVNREENSQGGCLYGEGEDKCIECFKKAIKEEYQ